MELETALKHYFGYDAFKEGQKEVIQSVLDGNHTAAMLPTGTGKSLCYQLPGYLFNGVVLIVSPLLSLMQDQVDQMKQLGEKRVVALNSFLSHSERKYVFDHLREYKFIYVSPEMLSLEFVIERFRHLKISLFVVDEAHCISHWGYDFRPEYSRLGIVRKKLNNPLTLALTATATPEVRADILHSLNIEHAHQVVGSVNRDNIALYIEEVENHQRKMHRLGELVKLIQKPGIIYFSSKKLAEQASEYLKGIGVERVSYYHGGMEQEQRILVQQQFLYGQLDVICATSAFGMGVNKDNVRLIIHFHMPLQIESYLQEIGRAGRDGKDSLAILLHAPGDEQLPIQLAEGELPSILQLEWLARWLSEQEVKLNLLHTFEADIRTRCGFTEAQWRFVYEHLSMERNNDVSLEDMMDSLKKISNDRFHLKRAEIENVKSFIERKTCRREYIMKYFRDTADFSTERCCDVCGFDINYFFAEIEQELSSLDKGWKSYLEKILLKK